MYYRCLLVLVLLISSMISGCSGEKDKNKETAVEEMTREVGQKAAARIEAPIDKARDAAALVDEHTKQTQEQAE